MLCAGSLFAFVPVGPLTVTRCGAAYSSLVKHIHMAAEAPYSSTAGYAEEKDIDTDCLLLPHAPYPGSPAIKVVGEVMLQELEDDAETRTQLFFNEDGTVSHGATDGPPPVGFCGLWQCGAEKFQMTIQRSFSSSPAVQNYGQQGRMTDDIVYTTTRVYEGVVEPTSTGVAVVTGRIDLFDADEASAAGEMKNDALKNIRVPPIGYFVIDAGTISEMIADEA